MAELPSGIGDAWDILELEGKVKFWRTEAEKRIPISLLQDLIKKWRKRAENEDNGTYSGEYFQPSSPSEVCAGELEEILKGRTL